MKLDVHRSFWRFPPDITMATRLQLRGKLTSILTAVLASNPERHYYQGFHEICAVVMLNTDARLALGLVTRLSNCHIRDHLAATLENAMAHCDLIYPLLARTRPELYQFIAKSDVQPQVAISWMLTWFCHDIDDLTLVSRIYDACIATHPFYPAYIAAALIETKEATVLAGQCEFTVVHKVLMAIDSETNFEDVLTRAAEIYADISPDEAVTLPQLSDRSREMLAKSAAVTGIKHFLKGQHEDDPPALFPQNPPSSAA